MTESSNDPDAVARLLRRRVADRSLELPVTGTSMAGTIVSGSRVWVRSQLRPAIGEVWAVVSSDGNLVVHRIRAVEGDAIVTRGTGNSIDDAPLDSTRLVGRVVKSVSPAGQVKAFDNWDRRRAAFGFMSRHFARRMLRKFRS